MPSPATRRLRAISSARARRCPDCRASRSYSVPNCRRSIACRTASAAATAAPATTAAHTMMSTIRVPAGMATSEAMRPNRRDPTSCDLSGTAWPVPTAHREHVQTARGPRRGYDLRGGFSGKRQDGEQRVMERRAVLIWLVVSLVVTAVLGLLAGLIWEQVAPRALLQEVSAGAAQVVNAETRAFIGADGWFCV